jgi:hypothetical protein
VPKKEEFPSVEPPFDFAKRLVASGNKMDRKKISETTKPTPIITMKRPFQSCFVGKSPASITNTNPK